MARILSVETAVPTPPRARNLLELAAREGWPIEVLGAGTPFSFATRMRLYLERLLGIPDDELVVLSDARDVLVFRSPIQFASAFADVTDGKELLACAELMCGAQVDEHAPDIVRVGNCTPLRAYWAATGTGSAARRYVNGGLLAGRPPALRRALAWMLDAHADDQVALGMYLNAFPERVALDVHACVLHTTNFAEVAGLGHLSQRADAPSVATFLGLGAFFVHFSGSTRAQAALYEGVLALSRAPHMSSATFRALATGAPLSPNWLEVYTMRPSQELITERAPHASSTTTTSTRENVRGIERITAARHESTEPPLR